LLLVVTAAPAAFAAESNWPAWRGPHADGHSAETGLPLTWDASSIAWRAALPGRGQSSPVIWGEKIFLTTALDDGKQRVVLCLSRADGKTLWQKIAWTGTPEPSHKMNGWASATCATDGERVYAFFGHGGGLFCYSVDGELVWSQDLGEFSSPWGTSACPILVGDLVIQNCDADADANLVAFNKKTGAKVWRTSRDNFRGWSTPVLVNVDGRQEIVLNGHTGVRAYDPATGKELWFCHNSKGRGEPTVTPGGGLLFAVNGLPGGDIYAVRPGGSGTVTDSRRAWHGTRSGGRDTPSPILVGNFLLVVSMPGVLTCYDSTTGKELWQSRLGGKFAASPIAYQGHAFFLDEEGTTTVVEPGPELKITARNALPAGDDEIFRASITPSAGQLFIRSDRTLYCVGTRK
jgi:outer membrane protein assembly factor BamB